MSLIILNDFLTIVLMVQRRNDQLLRQIGNYVKHLRTEKGLSQEDFYNDTGIHVGRLETGTQNVTVSTIDEICRYFGMSLEEFFRGLAKAQGR